MIDSFYSPLPAPVAPTPPDFHLCNPYYGTQLSRVQCEMAGGHLAVGEEPIELRSTGPYFPIVEQYGECVVTVSVSNPHEATSPPWDNAVNVTPNRLRQMASWINTICVNRFGLGGFATVSLQNMIDFVANDSTTNAQLFNGPWPIEAAFFTVILSSQDKQFLDPGYNDPVVAEALSDGVREKGNADRADSLSVTSLQMSRNQEVNWWDGFNQENPEQKTDMLYTCDSKLGAPSSVDCSQLVYSGLGPPSDTLTVGPGLDKFLSYKSCNAAITATTAITLTWAQISASLNALINSCVTHPLQGSQGGRASATSHVGSRRERRERRDKKRDVTGNNALPPGVTIALFKQNGALSNPAAEMTTCTWKQVLAGGNVNACP